MSSATTTLSKEDADRFRSYERQRHDNLATTYHDFFTPVTLLAAHQLLRAAQVRAGNDILDIATGPGSLAAEAKKLAAKPVGLDLSPGMIELARKSYPGIDFRVADVEHLPFNDGAFDAVVCNFALGHFPHPEAATAECVRTLKAGGHIALSWWDDPSKQRIQGYFEKQSVKSEQRYRPMYPRAIRSFVSPIPMSSIACSMEPGLPISKSKTTKQII